MKIFSEYKGGQTHSWTSYINFAMNISSGSYNQCKVCGVIAYPHDGRLLRSSLDPFYEGFPQLEVKDCCDELMDRIIGL